MRSITERFWDKVKVGKPEECWEWQGARGGKGNGHAVFKGPDTRSAYRQLYIWMHGPQARDVDICHSCDNGMCCNPRHLSTGTRAENMRQAVKRGRIRTRVKPPKPPVESWLVEWRKSRKLQAK
jgi:hypothetical protein